VALLAGFVVTSLVAGFLLAGLVIPAVGATGSAARGGVDFFDSLPTELEQRPLSQQSVMYAADGKTRIATFYEENRIVVPLKNIAPVMRAAIVGIEDSRFYEHGGVDPRGVLRAFVNNQTGGDQQGASTLTQQYVKNVLIEQAYVEGDEAGIEAAQEQTYSRKLREMKLAISLEKKVTKDEILERYLNIALYGDNVYGVEAASRYFFSTNASKLTLAQAATLAGLVQSPTKYNPRVYPERALERRNIVLKRMVDLQLITTEEYNAAVAGELGVQLQRQRQGCANATTSAKGAPNSNAYFCDFVVRTMEQDPAFAWMGATPQERRTTLMRGGLTIITTMDPKVQAAASAAVMKTIPIEDESKVAAAAVTIQPGTGNVVAMAENRIYDPAGGDGRTTMNYTVDQEHGGASYGFQPGSTFKAFTLATWLAAGKSLNDVVNAPGRLNPEPSDWGKSCQRPAFDSDWQPGNAGDTQGGGQVSVMQATRGSINTAYLSMSMQLDLCDIADTADKLGVERATAVMVNGKPTKKIQPYASMTLGSQEVTPIAMAGAYSAFAAAGKFCTPRSVVKVTTRDGKEQPVAPAACTQAISKEVAAGVTEGLSGVFSSGGTAARVGGIGRPASGKTGTTNDSIDTWFVGYTPQYATAVWVADPDTYRGGTRRQLRNIVINGERYRALYGGTLAAPTWKSIMLAAHKGLPVKSFPAPPSKMLHGSGVRVPNVAGQSVGSAVSELEAAGFQARVSGEFVRSDSPLGSVAYTSPRGGSRVSPGSTVTVHVSAGGRGGGGGGGDDGGDDNGRPGGGPPGNPQP
jgi:membrane peptidoglycan carboxypeptidase